MSDIIDIGFDSVDVVGSPGSGVIEVFGGPPGPRGEGNAFAFTQTVPGTVWTIEHDLGYNPGGVMVIDSDGFVRDGFGVQVLVPGVSLRLSFDISLAGVAYLS